MGSQQVVSASAGHVTPHSRFTPGGSAPCAGRVAHHLTLFPVQPVNPLAIDRPYLKGHQAAKLRLGKAGAAGAGLHKHSREGSALGADIQGCCPLSGVC